MLWKHRICYMQLMCTLMVVSMNKYLGRWIPFPCSWLHAAVVNSGNTSKLVQISPSTVSLVKLWLFTWKRYSLHFTECNGLFPWFTRTGDWYPTYAKRIQSTSWNYHHKLYFSTILLCTPEVYKYLILPYFPIKIYQVLCVLPVPAVLPSLM